MCLAPNALLVVKAARASYPGNKKNKNAMLEILSINDKLAKWMD
jgi:hypothetical protein